MLKQVLNGKFDALNFYKYPIDMPISGEYDLPVVKGIRIKHPEKIKLVSFDESHLIPPEERKQYTVHFFIYDYKFERVWTYIYKYTKYLLQFKAVISPDFSQYVDMPRAMQIWNLWRCNFMAYWWQSHGIPVIYNACWSDSESFNYTWDGAPRSSCICISSKGCVWEDRKNTKTDTMVATSSRFKAGLESCVDNLHPKQIVWIGIQPDWLKDLVEYYNIELIVPQHTKLYKERLKEECK